MSNEIKQGDKVRVSKDAPKMYLRGQGYFFIEDDCKVDMVEDDNAVITNGPRIIAIPAKYLVKVDAEAKEATAPKTKMGDRVRSKGYGLEAVVLGIDGDYIAVRRDDGMKQEWKRYMTELIKPTEQTEAEKKPNHTIKIPVEVDLKDSYWDAYTADLAKEVALKVANKQMNNHPEEIGAYAVSVAEAVVEGLKRK